MADLKNKALYGSVGATVAALLTLNLFARQSDVSDLRAEMYREFVTRREFAESIQNLDKKMDKVLDALYRRDK